MSREVWKYDLSDPAGTVEMPNGSVVVHVEMQHGDWPTLWADVPDDWSIKVARRFVVYGTGQPVNPSAVYIGSCLARCGTLVWHVFEETP